MTSQKKDFLFLISSNYENKSNSEFENEKDDFSQFDSSNIFNKSPFFGTKINNYIPFDEESKEKENDSFDNKEKEENLPDNTENSQKFTLKKRKRGPIKWKTDNTKEHKYFAADNCLRIIKVHYLSFIVSYINEILRQLQYKQKFYKLNYEFTKKAKIYENNSLKNNTIGQIISKDISNKYKYKNSDYNKKLFETLINNKNNKYNYALMNILSENYLELFKNIYFKSQKTIYLGKYGLDIKINLSNKVNMFKDLLLKYGKNDKRFYINMYACIKRNFIHDLIFLVNYNDLIDTSK